MEKKKSFPGTMMVIKLTPFGFLYFFLLRSITLPPTLFSHFPASNDRQISYLNILNYGANPNGSVDTSGALLEAWEAACRATGPATIHVPKGRFLTWPVFFSGEGCRNSAITIFIQGTLVAPMDHGVLGGAERWLTFKRVRGLAIVGVGGTLDANGFTWWSCKRDGPTHCPQRGAISLRFKESSNILVDGLVLLNSQKFHVGIYRCLDVRIQGVTIQAPGSSPNTDGIHVQSSVGVTISNSTIETGDDCISLGPGTKDLWVQHVTCGPGHGISIGSLGWRNPDAVENVTIKTVVFNGTTNGLRIKTWAKPVKSFVKDVLFEDVVMHNVKYPIIIDQNYCPHHYNCPNQDSGVKISNVTYKGIRGTSSTKIAMTFNCSPVNSCTGIKLEDVNLTYAQHAYQATSTCNNVVGTIQGHVQPNTCFESSSIPTS